MAKLTRKTQKIFAKDGSLGRFGSAALGSPVVSTAGDLADMQSLPAYTNGWSSAVLGGEKRPPLEEFNTLHYINNYQTGYLLQEGIAEYDVGTTYYQNSLVKESGTTNIYKSLTNDNIGNPLTDAANWEFRTALDESPTIVLVRSRDDFPTFVGNTTTLEADKVYKITGTVVMNPGDIIDMSNNGYIYGDGYLKSTLVSPTTGTLFISNGHTNIYIRELTIAFVGGGKLYDFTGNGIFARGEVFLKTVTISGSTGAFSKNCNLVDLNQVIIAESTGFDISNVGVLTLNEIAVVNAINTNSDVFALREFIGQSDSSRFAVPFAKPDQRIFNIDPAISDASNITIGTAVPYSGLQITPVAAFSDDGGGLTRVTTAIPHDYPNGRIVLHQNSISYNGGFQITVVDPVTYDIPAPFVGDDAAPKAITVFADNGSGGTTVTSNAHNLSDSQVVSILGTTNYNNNCNVFNVTLNTFDIPVPFVANDATGFWVLNPQAILLNVAATAPEIVPFFREGLTGLITAYASNGSGGTTVTSTAHGLTDGESVLIQNDVSGNYDGGYYIFNVTANTFDIATPFVANDATGDWNSGSLDQTKLQVTAIGTGGIVPDSGSLGNNILTTTVAFASTTTLTRISAGTWLADEQERFKATSDGRLIYTGRSAITVTISAKVVVQKQSGTTSTAFMNIMEKKVGAGSFTEIANHPSSQNQIQSSNASQLTIAAFVDKVAPGDEFAIGLASDSAFTMDVISIDFNIKK